MMMSTFSVNNQIATYLETINLTKLSKWTDLCKYITERLCWENASKPDNEYKS